MKKFMNDAGHFAAESLQGFVAAHDDLVVFGAGRKHVQRRMLTPGKVAVISGGGAGHEPMHTGFVGFGMLDAACTGHVFTSPTPDQILGAIRTVDTGSGVLLIVKNYDGDVMNFEMAAEIASGADQHIETLVVNDDIAVERSIRGTGRRGVAGTLVAEKIAGAAAEAGHDLAAVKAFGAAAVAATRTMGVALRGAAVPQTTRQTFVLAADEMEVGVGIHGEPGRAREQVADAAAITATICSRILDDFGALKRGQKILLFVNGLGSTPLSELYLVFGLAHAYFDEKGLTVARKLVGTYVTSLDMAGMSITVTVLDDALTALWDAPVVTAALRW